MQRVYLSIMLGIMGMGCICPQTYHGYGRYELRLDCDKVIIDETTYMVNLSNDKLVVQNHTIGRGINRKYVPWLYVHQYDENKIDVTFDTGDKPEYPLYVGASSTMALSYDHNLEIERSTNIACQNNRWLISHRWSGSGLYFDIQERLGADVLAWSHLGEVFVSADGSDTSIPVINSKVKIIAFDIEETKAVVRFSAAP